MKTGVPPQTRGHRALMVLSRARRHDEIASGCMEPVSQLHEMPERPARRRASRARMEDRDGPLAGDPLRLEKAPRRVSFLVGRDVSRGIPLERRSEGRKELQVAVRLVLRALRAALPDAPVQEDAVRLVRRAYAERHAGQPQGPNDSPPRDTRRSPRRSARFGCDPRAAPAIRLDPREFDRYPDYARGAGPCTGSRARKSSLRGTSRGARSKRGS